MEQPVFIFNPEEQAAIRRLAKVRSQGSRKNGLGDKRVAKSMSSEEIDAIGLAAEMAVGRYLGMQPRVAETADPGIDYTLSTGQTVDVKGTTNHSNPTLWFRRPPRADIGLLVTVDRATLRCVLIGWANSPGSYTSGRDLLPVETLRDMHEGRRDSR